MSIVNAMTAGAGIRNDDLLRRNRAYSDLGSGILELARSLSAAKTQPSLMALDLAREKQRQGFQAGQADLQRQHGLDVVNTQMALALEHEKQRQGFEAGQAALQRQHGLGLADKQMAFDLARSSQRQGFDAWQSALQRQHGLDIVGKQLDVNEPSRRLELLAIALPLFKGDAAAAAQLVETLLSGGSLFTDRQVTETVPQSPVQMPEKPAYVPPTKGQAFAPVDASGFSTPAHTYTPPPKEVQKTVKEFAFPGMVTPPTRGVDAKQRELDAIEADITRITTAISKTNPDENPTGFNALNGRLNERIAQRDRLLQGAAAPTTVPIEQMQSSLGILGNPAVRDAVVRALERSGGLMKGQSRLPAGFSLEQLPPTMKEIVMSVANDVINEGDTPENIARDFLPGLRDAKNLQALLAEAEAFVSPVDEQQLATTHSMKPGYDAPTEAKKRMLQTKARIAQEQAYRKANVEALARATSSPRFILELARAISEQK